VNERESEWTQLMRAAVAGDAAAYARLLASLTPVLRAAARRGLTRAGQSPDEAEDIVQDVLLAIHLKRHTWNAAEPLAPWVFAIARNKTIDALRRRGRRVQVALDDFTEQLAAPPAEESLPARDVERHLANLPDRQRDVVRSIAVEQASVRATADKLAMSEGAVRVALHRGLTTLAARLRED
jgi:RNA polymerase sigma-70 factor (ECF subfamily)